MLVGTLGIIKQCICSISNKEIILTMISFLSPFNLFTHLLFFHKISIRARAIKTAGVGREAVGLTSAKAKECVSGSSDGLTERYCVGKPQTAESAKMKITVARCKNPVKLEEQTVAWLLKQLIVTSRWNNS